MRESLTPYRWDEALEVPKWYAVYTHNRHEKKVATQLAEKGAVCFLPLRQMLSRWRDRRKLIEFPLFAGYVFVNLPLRDKLKVLTTHGVVGLVGFNSRPYPVPDEQIHALMLLMEEELSCDPHPYLKEGKRVEIKFGPLKGLRGILLRKKQNFKLVISVDLIQKSVTLEIDACDVEPV